MNRKLNFFDLFAGAGGLSEGFIRGGVLGTFPIFKFSINGENQLRANIDHLASDRSRPLPRRLNSSVGTRPTIIPPMAGSGNCATAIHRGARGT